MVQFAPCTPPLGTWQSRSVISYLLVCVCEWRDLKWYTLPVPHTQIWKPLVFFQYFEWGCDASLKSCQPYLQAVPSVIINEVMTTVWLLIWIVSPLPSANNVQIKKQIMRAPSCLSLVGWETSPKKQTANMIGCRRQDKPYIILYYFYPLCITSLIGYPKDVWLGVRRHGQS